MAYFVEENNPLFSLQLTIFAVEPASQGVRICCSIMLSEAHVELANDRDF